MCRWWCSGTSKIERSSDILSFGITTARVFDTPAFTHISLSAAAGVFLVLFG